MARGLFSDDAPPKRVLSVSELTARIKALLEETFPSVWVAGEISNFARPSSGHCYLTLKDDRAQVRAAMWRNTAARLPFEPRDGMEVLCRGHVDVYAPRGSYQLIIEQIEPKGIGALELALRQLREKLGREGLFDAERKRPLPPFVKKIAVVTSPTGAAIRDFLQVLARRWRGADVLILPSRVQGEGAAEEIAAAIRRANRLNFPAGDRPIDCLVVTRGGGSLEDLWAFNEEVVVRAIAASEIPVISAVGHEIDVTLADLVADLRALTPSEAAELVAPAADELLTGLRQTHRRLDHALRTRLSAAQSRLDGVARHPVFRRPLGRIEDLSRRVDELEQRSLRAMHGRLRDAGSRVDAMAGRLESLSPLAVLRRGYSITARTDDGRIVRNATEVTIGEDITTRLAQGELVSRIQRIRPSTDTP